MVFGLGSLEQMELDETRHALQIRVTAQPDFPFFIRAHVKTELQVEGVAELAVVIPSSSGRT